MNLHSRLTRLEQAASSKILPEPAEIYFCSGLQPDQNEQHEIDAIQSSGKQCIVFTRRDGRIDREP